MSMNNGSSGHRLQLWDAQKNPPELYKKVLCFFPNNQGGFYLDICFLSENINIEMEEDKEDTEETIDYYWASATGNSAIPVHPDFYTSINLSFSRHEFILALREESKVSLDFEFPKE
mgnify:CR=1 FL=1